MPREAEPVAQGCWKQTAARGCTHHGEGRQVKRNRCSAGAFAHDDVDSEVFHGHVEHFLRGAGHAVHFVDEEDFAFFQRRQNRREIARVLDGRARGDADLRVHFVGDDHRQSRFAKPRRSGQEHVIGCFAAGTRGIEHE